MPGFLDLQTPSAPGIGGLLGADFQRQAAMQNIIGTLIGFGQGPSSVPLGFGARMAQAAKAGQQSQRDYETQQLQQALVGGQLSKLQADATIAQQKAEAAKRQEALLAPFMTRLLGGGMTGGAGGAGAPGAPTGAAPAGPMSGDPLFNNSPQSNAVLSLIGLEPSKIHQNPFLRDNIDETGQKRTERWNPASQSWIREGSPEAQPGFAYLPDGGQAPIAGGPADPRYKGTVAATTAEAEMPFKPPIVVPKGSVMVPGRMWAGGGGGAGVSSPVGAPPAPGGQPAAPGAPPMAPNGGTMPYWKNGMLIGPTDPIEGGNKAKVEENLINMTGQLAQFQSIATKMRPEFQEAWTRLNLKGLGVREKLGMPIKPEDKAKLSAFHDFRADTSRVFNQTLKEMSGAAVTPQEFEKQTRNLPDPGTSIFDGDSPTEFESKVKNNIKFLTDATARLNYMRKNGIELGAANMPALDAMPSIINKRGKELDLQLKLNVPDQAARDLAVRQLLGREFGLIGN